MISLPSSLWLAGLAEGEFSWGLIKGRYPELSFMTVDQDTAERAARLMSVKVLGPYQVKATSSPIYSVKVYGEKCIDASCSIYPFLGQRRRAQVKRVLLGENRKTDRRRPGSQSDITG